MPAHSIIGVDLGGTKSAVARYRSDTLELEDKRIVPTHADRGFVHVLSDLMKLIQELRTPEVTAVGIGVPGFVRQPDGVLMHAPNIAESNNVKIKEMLGERLKLPVFVDNDARCFALAEARVGAGKGHRVVVGITMGTGVGGGVVIDGNIFHGEQGFAGELGHVLLMPGSPPYPTDNHRGEVEQFLSGTALGKRCEAAQRPEEYLEGQVCAFLQPQMFREVSWLCLTIQYVVNPGIIVLGGSTGRALKPHLRKIKAECAHMALPNIPFPDLAVAELDHAATLGAAMLASRVS